MGARISECFPSSFIYGDQNFWTFFGVLCGDQNFWTFLEFSLCAFEFLNVTFWSSVKGSEFLNVSFGVLSGGNNLISDCLQFVSSLWGSKYLHVFSLKVLNGDQMFCLSFGVLCGDLTFLNGTFWNSVWGIRILECFKKFFIGAEGALRFQELFMENSKNFWTFFPVV